MLKKIIQLTGLSGSGKTTLAAEVSQRLAGLGWTVEVLDGDELRKTISSDLGFSREDRMEHIRRMGQLAIASAADVVLIAAINPYEQARRELGTRYGAKLVWIDCSMDILRLRDTKGLYRRAYLPADHPEKLNNLTGVNDPFEHPKHADLVIHTHLEPVSVSAGRLTAYILSLPLPLGELADHQNHIPPVV